ncbi:MAG TPA: hypothetical protein VHL80_16330 [Polyangia bacterium]|nr:hypothetical protein [Polyangia bacterium]
MPTFEVTESGGWYEANCRELGVTITARRLDELEATALRTAARALGDGARVSLVRTPKKHEGLLARLAGFFARSGREGNS